MSNSPQGEERLTIWANSNVGRGKFAAAAVHTALNHHGIDHGAVIVLGAKPRDIEELCDDVIHDAGRTEVTPGTVTAGVFSHENSPARAQRAALLAKIEADLRSSKIDSTRYAEPGAWGVAEVMAILRDHL